jgi:uncharacterized membrane protein
MAVTMRRWKGRAKPPGPAYPGAMEAPGARIHLDTVITPERSLPMTGFKVLLAALIAVNLLMAIFFLALHATVVPIFLGLDVLGVFVAFRISYRRAMTRERVLVTADKVQVLREQRGQAREVWSSPTAFTRVDLDRSGRHGTRVRLALSQKRLMIGQALGPNQREDLARAIEAAILSAKSERHPSP